MRQLPWIVLGVIIGFLLGGIAPRRETAAALEKVSELKDDLKAAKGKASRRGMFGAPVPALDGLRGDRDRDLDDAERTDDDEGGDVVVIGDEPEGTQATSVEDARKSFNLAVEAQALRSSQSRQALVEQAGLDDVALADFDQVVTTMNTRLAEHADELVEMALSEEEPSSSELLGVSHDVTGILYDAQTELETLVGEEGMEDVDPDATQVWNYLDLESLRPAMERAERNGLLGGASTP
jgi:hypothetical protein